MRLKRSTYRVTAIAVGAAGVLVAAFLVTGTAQAATVATADRATSLANGSRDRSAVTYLDQASGRTVVTITDNALANSVRAAGATPRLVKHGAAQLAQATARLDSATSIPGTAWSTNVASHQVVVSADNTVTRSQAGPDPFGRREHGRRGTSGDRSGHVPSRHHRR